MLNQCIFCKIGRREVPVEPIFENDEFIAFHDLKPTAPIHALLIPKSHFGTLMDMNDPGLLGRAMQAVQETARILKIEETGFRTVINCREDGGQTVYHLHFHIIGGRFLSWPPG